MSERSLERTTPYAVPELASASPTQQFALGVRYAWLGVRIVGGSPALWPYVVAPVLITATIFFGTSFAVWTGVPFLTAALWQPGPATATWVSIAWTVAWIAVRLGIVFTIAFVLYFAAGLIATPFNDRLSEHVETVALGAYEEPFSLRVLLGDLANSVLHSILSMILWLTVMAISMSLNLLPVLGSMASLVIGTVATALFLTREAMDGPLSRRRMSYLHKLRIIRHNLPIALGFGLVGSMLVWVPFVNFLLLPMAVAGATLLYSHLEQQGRVPSARGDEPYVPPRARLGATHPEAP